MKCDAVPAEVSQEDGHLFLGRPKWRKDGGIGAVYLIADASIPDCEVRLTFPSRYSAQSSVIRYSVIHTEFTVVRIVLLQKCYMLHRLSYDHA
jgi:hypothetical protein